MQQTSAADVARRRDFIEPPCLSANKPDPRCRKLTNDRSVCWREPRSLSQTDYALIHTRLRSGKSSSALFTFEKERCGETLHDTD